MPSGTAEPFDRAADTPAADIPAAGPAAEPPEPGSARRSAAARDDATGAAEGAGATETRRLRQHFVYNSLNTIASLVRTDPTRARDLLLGFADLTRAGDRPAGTPTTLGAEIAAVRAYLQLEQARFGRRLRVEVAVDPALASVPVPAQEILGVVQATVQRSVEPRPEGGTVLVSGERDGDECLVRVAHRAGDDVGAAPVEDALVRLPVPAAPPGGAAALAALFPG